MIIIEESGDTPRTFWTEVSLALPHLRHRTSNVNINGIPDLEPLGAR